MDEIIDNKTTQTMQDVTIEEEKITTVNNEKEDDEFKSIYDTTDLVIRRKKILKKKIKHKSENSDNTNIVDDFTIVHQEEIDKV